MFWCIIKKRSRPMRNTCGLVLCFLFTAAIAIGWAEEKPITILSNGGQRISRSANKAISIWLERHPDNREVSIVCESGDFSTSSSKQLEGENSPRSIQFEFNLPQGEYECQATLIRNTDGKRKTFLASIKFFIS